MRFPSVGCFLRWFWRKVLSFLNFRVPKAKTVLEKMSYPGKRPQTVRGGGRIMYLWSGQRMAPFLWTLRLKGPVSWAGLATDWKPAGVTWANGMFCILQGVTPCHHCSQVLILAISSMFCEVRPVRPVRPLKRRRVKVNLKVTGLSLGSTLWSHSSVTDRTERTEQTNSSRVGTALSWWLWKWDEGPCNLQGWPCTVGLFFSDECAEFALRTRCAKRLNFCGSKTWTVTSWSKGSCWDVTPCPLHCHCPPLSTPLRRPWATPLYWSYFGSSWVKTDSKRLDFWQNYLHWVTELVTVCSTWSYHCNCAARLCV